MRRSLGSSCEPVPLIRIALVAILTLLLSGWTTCTAIVNFDSCPAAVPQPRIISLSPGTIPSDAESVLLTVNGSGFTPQSQIMWNATALQTTFIDSHHLQAAITQQTFDSFGGSVARSAQISVGSQGSGSGCPPGGNSAALVLDIS